MLYGYLRVFYTIYKTTNNINGKYYIGKHKTQNLDDNYLGSGKILNHAIKKHGINNFTKEYLFIFDNEEDMNNKEAELVSIEFIKEDTNYNLAPGGKGGFAYETSIKGSLIGAKKIKHLYATCAVFKAKTDKRMAAMTKVSQINNPNGTFYGKTHSDETKAKMRKPKNIGKENSQYGTMWIHSLIEQRNTKINKNDVIPEGWYKGRKMKF